MDKLQHPHLQEFAEIDMEMTRNGKITRVESGGERDEIDEEHRKLWVLRGAE